MPPEITPKKTFWAAGMVSLICHLVFAMTAGAYFLNREPVPERKEVRVKIIEKKQPDKPKVKEKKVQPKLETVPVVQPVEMPQPVQPQQVQVASAAVAVSDVQPVVIEQATAPSNAPAAKMIHSRAMTAVGASAKPVRSVAVNTLPMASTHTVQPRATSVRTIQTPTPVAVTPSAVTGTQGTARSGIVGAQTSARRTASVQAVTPVADPGPGKPAPTEKAAGPASAPVQVASLPPGPSTDLGVLEGYKNGLHKRLSYVAQKRYQRSPARRANQEGKVMVAFTVLRNGEVKNVYVKEASDHALLNQTALEAIKQAAPFTEFPEDILEKELNLVIPFSFTLR